ATGAFEPPTWVGLRVDRDKIYANWDAVPGAMAYNVYRSVTPGGPYEVVGNVTTSKFADNKGLEAGKTYYYVLTALNDQFEETEKSAEKAEKFGISATERKAADTTQQNIKLEEIKLTLLFELTDAGSLGPMNQPADVVVNSKGDIYVNDVLNFRVNVYNHDGNYKFSFGRQTPPADKANPPQGSFSLPLSMTIDKQDKVYVGDVDQNDIQIFTADGKFLKRITVAVKEDMKPFRPNGLFVAESGQILTTDGANHRFLVLDPDGKVIRSVGSGGEGPGNFLFVDGILMTPDSIICVVDVMNCRVQEFDFQGKFIRSFGEAGQTVGTFARPKGLAVDAQKRIWVSDGMGNSVQVFTLDGQVKAAFTDPVKDKAMAGPRGMLIEDGRFYLVNRLLNAVWVFKIG
ncbi:MAG: SMP-30/gluconolactonase/LRE family protein, partial [Candidatus Kerfeldbacteria bacterium]|nr:SMP-30/gluconolactonase/LRE family protein [Candidatus Kerfeldbacteria bacterium]